MSGPTCKRCGGALPTEGARCAQCGAGSPQAPTGRLVVATLLVLVGIVAAVAYQRYLVAGVAALVALGLFVAERRANR